MHADASIRSFGDDDNILHARVGVFIRLEKSETEKSSPKEIHQILPEIQASITKIRPESFRIFVIIAFYSLFWAALRGLFAYFIAEIGQVNRFFPNFHSSFTVVCTRARMQKSKKNKR